MGVLAASWSVSGECLGGVLERLGRVLERLGAKKAPKERARSRFAALLWARGTLIFKEEEETLHAGRQPTGYLQTSTDHLTDELRHAAGRLLGDIFRVF